MEPIHSELVEETWQEVARFDPDLAGKEMMKAGNSQPELLTFMVEFTQDLNQEVQELAIYMFFVVYRMFQKSSKKKIRKIPAEDIIECYEDNEDLMQSLEGAHEKFFERIARVQLARQPYVMKYVVDTLIEGPEDEDPVALAEDDVGLLFLLLKTVVEAIDKVT